MVEGAIDRGHCPRLISGPGMWQKYKCAVVCRMWAFLRRYAAYHEDHHGNFGASAKCRQFRTIPIAMRW